MSPQWLNADIEVRNAGGQLVLRLKTRSQQFWLNLESQPDGIYWVRISKNKQSIIRSLIKKGK